MSLSLSLALAKTGRNAELVVVCREVRSIEGEDGIVPFSAILMRFQSAAHAASIRTRRVLISSTDLYHCHV